MVFWEDSFHIWNKQRPRNPVGPYQPAKPHLSHQLTSGRSSSRTNVDLCFPQAGEGLDAIQRRARGGHTTSAMDVEYGLIAHYKFVYGGFTARHVVDRAPPYFARWIVGVTFSTGGGSRREESTRRRSK